MVTELDLILKHDSCYKGYVPRRIPWYLKNKISRKGQKRYMEASNSVVKEVKKELETEKFKIINSFQIILLRIISFLDF